MKRLMLIFGILLLMTGLTMAEDEYTHYENEISYQKADRAVINIDFGMGRLDIARGQGDFLARVVGDYDEELFYVVAKYEESGNTGYFTFEFKKVKGISLKNWAGDEKENKWKLLLGDKIPLQIDLNAGMSANNFDLSGLKIEKLDMDVGMSSNEIIFTKPNPVVMTDFIMDAGKSSTEIYGLGNANFRRLTIDSGMSSSILDFSGRIDYSADITIDASMSSTEIILPNNIGLKVKAPTIFTSTISLPRNLTETGRGMYESKDYNNARNQFYFDIDSGMGSVDVKFAESM